MLTLLKQESRTVIVKDMSRLGRNYLQVGMYTEMIFHRKVSASSLSMTEGQSGENDFPAAEHFNEWLVRYEQENQGSKTL